MIRKYLLLLTTFISIQLNAQKKVADVKSFDDLKQIIMRSIDGHRRIYRDAALKIWDFAEVGYKEEKSSALLQDLLIQNGFEVKNGIAEIPTAFVASYGSGSPVIAILAEYDALPGLSQNAVPEKSSIENQDAGHACGHHLFGVGSVAASIAIKEMIQQKNMKGTLKVFGCPAEEGGSGKVYLVRAGFFNDVDVALHWHPSDRNLVTMTSALANTSAKFRFHGIAAHAAGAPEKGRSALDAVEAMNYMVNMMREHVPQETRIHYVITDGGKAPNVVPDFAEVYYYVRHPNRKDVKQIFDRVVKAAQAAALGTETTMDYEIIGGTHDLLINRILAENMQKNLQLVGGVKYTPEEIVFAQKIQNTFNYQSPNISMSDSVISLPNMVDAGGGSTDVGDVSYVVPTVGLRAATWVPGTAAHSWQAVASGGTEIGVKGMMVAAKAIALTTLDLFSDAELIRKAKSEFLKEKGDYKYEALLGDRKPALNYRD